MEKEQKSTNRGRGTLSLVVALAAVLVTLIAVTLLSLWIR